MPPEARLSTSLACASLFSVYLRNSLSPTKASKPTTVPQKADASPASVAPDAVVNSVIAPCNAKQSKAKQSKAKQSKASENSHELFRQCVEKRHDIAGESSPHEIKGSIRYTGQIAFSRVVVSVLPLCITRQ
ncbi:hypothetical protein [Paraburkholderia sp. C35]|uniref:hypothetical protein n=1 Tax=Paraburkholderia sp. C35 TaxID=2126993 RepID=UPI001EF67C61|nr:hypothetical protein [Paraburkholderia sp. C35]